MVYYCQLGDYVYIYVYIYVYVTYHLLREPETAIDITLLLPQAQWKKKGVLVLCPPSE